MRVRQHKYNVSPKEHRTVDGIVFASKKEARRYSELKMLATTGAIDLLSRQVPFYLIVRDIQICKYIADFVYRENGKQVVEDCKGFKTPEYRLKKKLMKAILGIEIKEV